MIKRKIRGFRLGSFKVQFFKAVLNARFCLPMILIGCMNEKSVPVTKQCNANINKSISYVNEVKPILAKNCYSCHDNKDHFGGCRLEDIADVQSWAASGELQYSVFYNYDNIPIPKMPKGGKLDDCDIATITNWVNQGAKNN